MYFRYFCVSHLAKLTHVDCKHFQNSGTPNYHKRSHISMAAVTRTNTFQISQTSLCYFWRSSQYCQKSYCSVCYSFTLHELTGPFGVSQYFFLSHWPSPGNKTNPICLCYHYQVTGQMHCGLCYCHQVTRQIKYGLCYTSILRKKFRFDLLVLPLR